MNLEQVCWLQILSKTEISFKEEHNQAQYAINKDKIPGNQTLVVCASTCVWPFGKEMFYIPKHWQKIV